jgi:hypothetical protein
MASRLKSRFGVSVVVDTLLPVFESPEVMTNFR